MSAANLQHGLLGQNHRRSVDSAAGQELPLPPQDPAALRTNSPYRYHHDIFVTSTEEVRGSQQSPPTYHRVPTSSQVALDSRSFADLETPPYRSRVNLAEKDEKAAESPMPEDRVVDEKAPLKGVHYPSDLGSPHVHRPAIIRVDSDAPSVAGTDDEYEEDSNYDWSGEEDLIDEEIKFEEQMGKKQKQKGWNLKRIVTLLFSSLIGSMFLAGLLITTPILLHFYWYKKNPTEKRRYALNNIEAWLFWAAANLIVSWWLALIVDLVPVVFLTLISIGWGHISEGVKGSIELFNGIKDTVKPIFYAASMWVSWVIIFESIFKLYNDGDPDASKAAYTQRVYQVIRFLFFLALVVSVQRMISQSIAQTFHETAYKERLDAVGETLRVVETLRDYKPVRSHQKKPSGVRTPIFSPRAPSRPESRQNSRPASPVVGSRDGHMADSENEESPRSNGKRRSALFLNPGRDLNDPSVSMASVHSYPPTLRNGANTPTRRRDSHDADGAAAVVTQAAKALKTAVLHDARNLKGKDGTDRALVWDVTNSAEAKRLARLIYLTFRQGRRKYLLPQDFHPAFPTPEEAEKAFRVFDNDNNGDISRREIKTVLLKVYKERRFLSRSMRDVGAALKTLDRILLFFALVILFFISLSVFGVEVGSSLSSVYSIGIAASFIFKSAASNAFDSIMFLFVTHPFDTGDRCFIGEENLVVKKMGLFATVFTRADGTETYYFNSQLFNMFITNARRSAKTFENLSMKVAWKTPMEKFDALEACMNEWLQTEEHRWFEPSTTVAFQHIHYQRHLELTIGIGHNGNWQDWGLRLARKTAFHAAVQYFCRQLGIVAAESPIPIVYADRDTQMWENPDFVPPELDDGSSVINMQQPASPRSPTIPWAPAHPSGLVPGHGSREKISWLGFEPPTNQPSALRARRAKSKKAVMRSQMGDG